MDSEKCPCCSGKLYSECCEPIIKGAVKAETPEALMRSRYSAYAKAEIDHLVESTAPSQRESIDREEMRLWAERSTWLGLEIIEAPVPAADETTGFVEFIARYTDRDTPLEHHERAAFSKIRNEWFFYDGKLVQQKPYVRTAPKIERNAPCPCGSGKKYKKCCGK